MFSLLCTRSPTRGSVHVAVPLILTQSGTRRTGRERPLLPQSARVEEAGETAHRERLGPVEGWFPVSSWCAIVGVPASVECTPDGAEERRVWRNGRRPHEVHNRKGQDCRPGDHEGEAPEVDVPRMLP